MKDNALLPGLPPVYPITDKRLACTPDHLQILRELVRGGATLVQVRDKDTPARELLSDLMRCAEFCDRHAVTLLVNDRCDLVLCAGASGVHLGQDDLPPVKARKLLGPDSIIGYSTHSLRQIREATVLPVQYLGFGPIYATTTKRSLPAALGIPALRRACRATRMPVVAIGGIGCRQISEVLRAGAASAAVISAVMSMGGIARAMERLLRAARAMQ